MRFDIRTTGGVSPQVRWAAEETLAYFLTIPSTPINVNTLERLPGYEGTMPLPKKQEEFIQMQRKMKYSFEGVTEYISWSRIEMRENIILAYKLFAAEYAMKAQIINCQSSCAIIMDFTICKQINIPLTVFNLTGQDHQIVVLGINRSKEEVRNITQFTVASLGEDIRKTLILDFWNPTNKIQTFDEFHRVTPRFLSEVNRKPQVSVEAVNCVIHLDNPAALNYEALRSKMEGFRRTIMDTPIDIPLPDLFLHRSSSSLVPRPETKTTAAVSPRIRSALALSALLAMLVLFIYFIIAGRDKPLFPFLVGSLTLIGSIFFLSPDLPTPRPIENQEDPPLPTTPPHRFSLT